MKDFYLILLSLEIFNIGFSIDFEKYTIDEARIKISKIQSINSKKRWKKHKLNPKYETLNTRIEYYISKGLI